MRDFGTQSRAGFISRMRCEVRQTALVLVAMIGSGLYLPVVGAAPLVLSAPNRLPGEFQVSVSGDVGSPYIVESSTNLQSWQRVFTNREPTAMDTLLLSAAGERNFYRAFVAVPFFGFALAAKNPIDLAGNNLVTDSFDSSDPTYSTSGLYDASKHKAGGDVGAYLGITNTLALGNADIWGRVLTGPGAILNIGPQGSVGEIAWHLTNHNGIEPGFYTEDMNSEFPLVTSPTVVGFSIGGTATTYNGTYYDYTLFSGYYYIAGGYNESTKRILVIGDAALSVRSNFLMSGSASVTIAPGASLKLYVNGSTASLGGNGVINNSYNALNFIYYGTTNNTSVSVGGNSSFTGCIYAPSANIVFNGSGGSSYYDFTGCCIGSSIRLNGHFNFHFDEALKRFGPLH